ncbi:HK97 family phage prohead protease [Eubacterium pyruvativorans]|uniref:HK97 family phage prohead protease n=1 Tax=Eubacterium pyruvativorans TaxID=155865 RepID=UPI003F8B1D5F
MPARIRMLNREPEDPDNTPERGESRTFQLSFSSEEPYDRWFGPEILDHSDGAVDLERLNSMGVLLYNHNRDAVVGRIDRAWVEDGRGEAEVTFDEDELSETIYSKVKSGTLKGVSVGYIVRRYEEIESGGTSEDGRFEGPAEVATDWVPLEISIVSIPADPTVGVGRSYEPSYQSAATAIAEKQIEINKNLI